MSDLESAKGPFGFRVKLHLPTCQPRGGGFTPEMETGRVDRRQSGRPAGRVIPIGSTGRSGYTDRVEILRPAGQAG